MLKRKTAKYGSQVQGYELFMNPKLLRKDVKSKGSGWSGVSLRLDGRTKENTTNKEKKAGIKVKENKPGVLYIFGSCQEKVKA